MNKKVILLFIIFLGLAVLGLILFLPREKNYLSSPKANLINIPKILEPSKTYIDYSDPSGFNFSYPDNLSIQKAEIDDPNTYADLQLFSKDVNGSLNLKITDSKLNSLDEWLKANNIPESTVKVEKKLGNLNAIELKTEDRLLLGALDQGILFSIEVPLIEQEFWMKAYDQVLASFSFVAPAESSSQTVSASLDEVIFEGEEVVE